MLRRSALLAPLLLLPLLALLPRDARADLPPHPWSLASVPGAAPVIAQLGTTDDTALSAIMSAVKDGTPDIPFDLERLKTDGAARVQLVRSFGPVLERIVASAIFRQIYAGTRQAALLEQAGSPPATSNDAVAGLTRAIADAQHQLADPSVAAEMKRVIRTTLLPQLQQQLAAARQAAADPAQAAQRQSDQAAYQQSVTQASQQLESTFPSDPNVLVTTRLTDFLTMTAAMPWTARLNGSGNSRTFADATLEAKSPFWKMCFRAGQPTVDAARAFAQSWLTDLHAPRPTHGH